MNRVAVRVEGLSKRYRIGEDMPEWYKTLRGSLSGAARAPFRAIRSKIRGSKVQTTKGETTFWALKDLALEIQQGEVVGLIGHNGAGKSTLLKILSRITEPTEGFAEIHGRISSLLEVGTGFHAELTGRENIYMNGALLGMKRTEIKRKFDEIVSFAEVERFIDTPVKHYSSGMYLRLAFGVAAHLEPEVLLVDEVLAVGDAAFQKKCLGKMGEVAHEGRTVILVSHNMAAITNLCTRTAVLKAGQLDFYGDTQLAIAEYINGLQFNESEDLSQRADRGGWGQARIQKVMLLDENGSPKEVVQSGEPVTLAVEYLSSDGKPIKKLMLEVKVTSQFGELLFTLSPFLTGRSFENQPVRGTIYCHLPAFLAAPDVYNMNLFLYVNGEIADRIPNAGRIQVIEGDFFDSGRAINKKHHGAFIMPQSWSEVSAPKAGGNGAHSL